MLELNVFKRELKEKAKQRRRLGFVPGIIYGHNIKNLPIEVPLKDFQRIYRQVGESTLLILRIDKEAPRQVLIHKIQFHPVTDAIEHVDFYQVRSNEKVTIEIEFRFVGVSPAVHEKGGILVTPLNKLKIECLPADLVHELEIDLSNLKEIRDMIRVKDLEIPPKIRVLNNPDEVVAIIEAPRVEEEIKKPEEKPEVVSERAVSEGAATESLRKTTEQEGRVKENK